MKALRQRCRELGLSASGRKQELIGRLSEYERARKSQSASVDKSRKGKAGVFGIDPHLQNLNVVEHYATILSQYKNDPAKVAEHFDKISFRVIYPFRLEDNKQAEKKHWGNLRMLATGLNQRGILKKPIGLKDSDFADKQLRDRFESCFVVLRYKERHGARFWQNKWAKEMRGTVVFVHPETSKVSILGFKLPRGAEMSDIRKAKKRDIYDQEQVDTLDRVTKGKPIKLHLSSKADGCLLVISAYEGKAKDIMLSAVEAFGTEYARVWASESLAITNSRKLILPATQGTMWCQPEKQGYMTTSILVGSGVISRQELLQFEAKGGTAVTACKKWGGEIIRKFDKLRTFPSLSDTSCFSFEAICTNRQGLFGDRVHNELACAHNRDRLIFLGASLAERRFFLPHSVYGEKCMSSGTSVSFEEPLWWGVDDASQVKSMMKDMGAVVLQKMDKSSFLHKWRPSNSTLNLSDRAQVENAMLSYEGWVIMKYSAFEHKDADYHFVTEKLGTPLTIYSKIKLDAYYKAHKIHPRNIQSLIELSKVAGRVFPLAQDVALLTSSGDIVNGLMKAGPELRDVLTLSPDSILMKHVEETLFEKSQNRKMIKGAKKGANVAKCLQMHSNIEIKYKIIFEHAEEKFLGSLLLPVYAKHFNDLDGEIIPKSNSTGSVSVLSAIKTMTQNLRPWAEGYSTRVKSLNVLETDFMLEFICACLAKSLD
uniref:SAP domain-containing protein n=1 Tax=Lotharella globosa TaxID=91324 RepID=A0A7S3Z8R0_9EUKA|mmetsp:Transcript_20772/g.41988  ORF Transcript_20772/g.41988 Transcript_20772/m.41988 type:complete len:711 (+) Transcript_20772:31-2163(+)